MRHRIARGAAELGTRIHELLEAVGLGPAAEVAAKFSGYDRVGITFPGVVVDGVTRTAANVDKTVEAVMNAVAPIGGLSYSFTLCSCLY